jgi:predicted nuclease of predicted toxin-antitoxin system
MKLLFDESLSPRLIDLLNDLFPASESALKNGLARTGKSPGAKVIILRFCDYPTKRAAEILRRNAIRIAEFSAGHNPLLLVEP